MPVSPAEVKAQLKRLPSSSAPGPDRLPYKVWKAIDPDGVILARIFEVCRREKKVPSAWKKSTTILIPKEGDEALPSNWRPISLQNAVYKVYAAIWGRRLACWAGETGAISSAQKGFVPGEGCLEHSFLVRSMMEDARRRHRPLHLVWFDLRNAFGSDPHDLIWHSMRKLGVPEEAVSILMDIYEGSTLTVQTAEGATDDIPQQRGVKQGCPISPLIFNLAIEGLIRGIQSSAARGYSFTESLEVKCLAYADDLAIAASSEEDVEAMLARLEEFSWWSHMDFNVAKRASLSTTIGEARGWSSNVILRGLRAARGEYWLGRWTGLAEQGGLAGSFSRTPESNYWIRECRYLRYREYRWALKARLNLLPVASHKRKYGGSAADTRCRGCTGVLETQEYCLSVCQGNMAAMHARHDQLL